MENVRVNGNGYIHIHMAILNNKMWFNDVKEEMQIGEALTAFLYVDLNDLRRKPKITEADIEKIHPYFHYGSSEWKTAFIHHLEGATRVARMPDLSRLIELQHIYKELMSAVFKRQNPYEDKHFLDDKLSQSILVNGTACFSSMKIMPGGSFDYFVSTFEECLLLEFSEVLKRKIIFRACRNCGQFFIPKRSNMDYCPRIFTEDGKTCSEVGYTKTFAESVKNDELLLAYTRAYKAHYARMTKPRKKSANMTREEFDSWYKDAKHRLDLARAGHIDPDEFKEWLRK